MRRVKGALWSEDFGAFLCVMCGTVVFCPVVGTIGCGRSTRSIGIVVAIRGIVVNGIACPLLSFVGAGCCCS